VGERLQAKTGEVVGQMARILDAARDVERRLETLSAPAFEPARRDVRAQLARLVFAGFATRTGAARLADVERYLHGAVRRLERLPDATAVDRDRMRALGELEQAYRARLEGGGLVLCVAGVRRHLP